MTRYRRKSRSLVLRERRIVVIFCPRISQCRMNRCDTRRVYEKRGLNIFCVNMSYYDEGKAISSVEALEKRIKDLGL